MRFKKSPLLFNISKLIVFLLTSRREVNSIDSKEFGGHYQAMCMIALTFSGLVMVYRICRPFNVYRAVLCASMLALCITAFAIPQIAEQLYKGWSPRTLSLLGCSERKNEGIAIIQISSRSIFCGINR